MLEQPFGDAKWMKRMTTAVISRQGHSLSHTERVQAYGANILRIRSILLCIVVCRLFGRLFLLQHCSASSLERLRKNVSHSQSIKVFFRCTDGSNRLPLNEEIVESSIFFAPVHSLFAKQPRFHACFRVLHHLPRRHRFVLSVTTCEGMEPICPAIYRTIVKRRQ